MKTQKQNDRVVEEREENLDIHGSAMSLAGQAMVLCFHEKLLRKPPMFQQPLTAAKRQEVKGF